MADTDQYVSQEGLEKLKTELEERKNTLRPQIAKKIVEATGYGDLSENAEYVEAKEMQAFNEGRIEELENIVRHAVIIQHERSSIVTIGSTVKVESKQFGEKEFTIVGPSESNPALGFISNESPLGKAFIDQMKGNEVEVKTPSGKVTYRILEIK